MKDVQLSIDTSIDVDRQMMKILPSYKVPEYSLLNPKHEIY